MKRSAQPFPSGARTKAGELSIGRNVSSPWKASDIGRFPPLAPSASIGLKTQFARHSLPAHSAFLRPAHEIGLGYDQRIDEGALELLLETPGCGLSPWSGAEQRSPERACPYAQRSRSTGPRYSRAARLPRRSAPREGPKPGGLRNQPGLLDGRGVGEHGLGIAPHGQTDAGGVRPATQTRASA